MVWDKCVHYLFSSKEISEELDNMTGLDVRFRIKFTNEIISGTLGIKKKRKTKYLLSLPNRLIGNWYIINKFPILSSTSQYS
ncbi:CLUMA_CG013184, isoform A [Clunio marinus]|uniref:CLUMA_CG013184, isoform A n=1 Tax=Clunio marinus TaxID=568069 RepID=A0A1J1IN28_9DIPT|nr:CLUMA_CG013184, isoform A [Clunio marinus]